MTMSDPLPSNRSFGMTFAVVFALIAAWQGITQQAGGAITFGALSAVTLIIVVANPALLRPLNHAWMKLGVLLHAVVSPIVLGAIYFIIITPFGLAMRLGGRDALRRQLDRSARSYWIRREPPGPPPDSLPNQY